LAFQALIADKEIYAKTRSSYSKFHVFGWLLQHEQPSIGLERRYDVHASDYGLRRDRHEHDGHGRLRQQSDNVFADISRWRLWRRGRERHGHWRRHELQQHLQQYVGIRLEFHAGCNLEFNSMGS